MHKQLTFIHAADLHLGAPFRGLRALSDAWADRLLTAIPEAYDRIVVAAIERSVDFVIFAGDIFDNGQASYGDYLHFFEGLRRLNEANIPVYLCSGNHDPFTSWQHDFFALPPNTTMLPGDKPGFVAHQRDGETLALIGGRGYYNQTWPIDEDIAAGVTRVAAEAALESSVPDVALAPFAVGVLHTGLDLDKVKAPTRPENLLRSGMNYWALGHIHIKYAYPSFENPRIVFSGCIQGRDIKESGERGCYVVTLSEDKNNKIEFLPTASVVWQRMDISVSDCINVADVTDKIMRELFRVNGKARCEEMCVRITLTGASSLHTLFARPGMLEDLRKHINDSYAPFFCDALVDNTRYPRSKETLLQEGLFPAVFIQVAQAQRANSDEEIAFLQEEFLKKNIQLPSSYTRMIDVLAEDAENLVIDLLSREEQ